MRIEDGKVIEIVGDPTLKAATGTAKRFAAQVAG